MNISDIQTAVTSQQVLITNHADLEAEEDDLQFEEIFASVLNGEIIEHYPDDKPYPSCLILGTTSNEKPIHSVWAYDQNKQIAILITVYCPDPERWINWRVRKN
jgi:hypothetical protein